MSFSELLISERHISTELYSIWQQPQTLFREIKQIATEVKAMAGVLNNSEDTVMVGPIIRVAMERISITCMTYRQNSMAHLVVYAVVLIIPLSTATKENMT